MRGMLCVVGVLICLTVVAEAGSIERVLRKLDPEERAHQACALKGINKIRRDGRLPRADRLKAGVNGQAVFTGTKVVTKGGAVRAKHRWYALTYNCEVTKDQMKALSFTYEIGPEIPESKWADLGLWR